MIWESLIPDLINIIYLSSFIICMFGLYYLLYKWKWIVERHQLILLIFFFSAALSQLLSTFFRFNYFELYVYSYPLGVLAILSLFPLFYLYIKHIVSDNEKISYWYYLSLPLVMFVVAGGLHIFYFNLDDTLLWAQQTSLGQSKFSGDLYWIDILDNILRKIFVIQAIVYFIYTNRAIIRLRKKIENEFSDIESSGLYWFNTLRVYFIGALIAGILYYVLGRSQTQSLILLPMISHLLIALFFFNLLMFSEDQNLLYPKYKELIKRKINTDEVLEILNTLIDKKIFLNNKLSLQQLSLLIGTNKTYLSQVINREYHKNFNDFINELRIEHAIDLIQKGKINLSGIYDLAGFNSSATFYRAFKKYKGVSPTDYILTLDN